jgi:hypothetical protein
MEAIRLDPSMKKQAARVYARAFFDYPMFTFYFPDRARREHHLASYFEVLVNYGFLYGQLYTLPDISGVACWLPPGSTDTPLLRIIRAGGLSVIPKVGLIHFFTHNMKHENYLVKVHQEIMPGPHFYLWGIVVDPNYQGMGIGKALMQPGMDQADAQSVPIYLETHDEKNVLYYQKMGFDLIRTETLPGFDLKFWPMVRPPR